MRVRRGNGDIEDGWSVKYFELVDIDNTGIKQKRVVLERDNGKEGPEREMEFRSSLLEELEELNPEIK